MLKIHIRTIIDQYGRLKLDTDEHCVWLVCSACHSSILDTLLVNKCACSDLYESSWYNLVQNYGNYHTLFSPCGQRIFRFAFINESKFVSWIDCRVYFLSLHLIGIVCQCIWYLRFISFTVFLKYIYYCFYSINHLLSNSRCSQIWLHNLPNHLIRSIFPLEEKPKSHAEYYLD